MSLHRVFAAALELQEFLQEIGRPYCFIGGMALQRWGEVRYTEDADATVLTGFEFDEQVINLLLSRFKSRVQDGVAFALRNRVVVLTAGNGVGLDVALGALEFEARAASRASAWLLQDGNSLRTCSAEDLIVHKAFAARDQDWADIHGILVRQGSALNVSQIFADLRPLVALKEDESIVPRLEALMRKYLTPG
jgi:hypothetical protein